MKFTFERPALYLVTCGEAAKENYHDAAGRILDIVRLAVDRGIPLVQIRERSLTARLLYELVKDAASITRGGVTSLLVSDRADIALAAGADGVHLTSRSLSTRVVKEMSPELIIGRSTHHVDEVLSAKREGADYALFGPVFETPGKEGVQGIDRLRTVCSAAMPFPVIAIGGIDDTNARRALDAGAAGVAAIRALNDPEGMARLMGSLDAG